MNEDQILEKIKTCFNSVFFDDFNFSKELSRENFEHWDSMHHISLLVEIEKTFGFRFDGATVSVLTSVDNILTEIKMRLN
jgi:acyl carrier protein